MSNNRLYLINKRTGTKVLLSKFFPSVGWYSWDGDSLGARLDAMFDAAHDAGDDLNSPWTLEYEHDEGAEGTVTR